MRFLALFLAAFLLLSSLMVAATPTPRQGWSVLETTYGYDDLIDRVKAAAKAEKMGVVTQAGPTEAAKARGVTIPGNRVIGVFNNHFAVRMLSASEAAMIEAPIRFYVTEQPDGKATLSYKTPSLVFAPYADDSPEVMEIAAELDVIFAAIARGATE